MDQKIKNRTATWIELFFDLIFVVAIAKAAHVIQHPHDGHIEGLAYFKYILIIVPVWWAWVGSTLFANRFDYDDLFQRLLIFIQMFFVIVLAANINTDFDSYYRGFLLAYIAIRSITVVMYLRTSFVNKNARSVSNFLAISFSIGVLISLSSLFFDGTMRYIVLYTGIGFDIVIPLFAKKNLKSIPVHAHHLPERFGLLTIILLGESVLSLANSFDALEWSTISVVTATCGFFLICGLWWLYFTNIERRFVGPDLGHGHGIIYSHLFIYAGLGGIAAMIKFSVIPELNLQDYKILSGLGILCFILALQFLHLVYHPEENRKVLLFNALLFDVCFIVLLIFSSSIIFIIAGTMLLIALYAFLDHRMVVIDKYNHDF